KDVATSMLGCELEGVKDRLAPSRSTRLRKNSSNDVHQLRLASHFDPIGVVQQCYEGAPHHQGILQVVDLFNQSRSNRPSWLDQMFARTRFVPHVPFVEGEHDSL